MIIALDVIERAARKAYEAGRQLSRVEIDLELESWDEATDEMRRYWRHVTHAALEEAWR